MKQIKTYIDNIDSNLLKSISGRPGELIELIRSNKFISEKALEAQLFSGKNAHQNFLNLKTRTKRILNAFLIISSPKKNNKTLNYFQECRSAYHSGMYFMERGNREESKKLLIKALKLAKKNHFTTLSYNIAIELRTHASINREKSAYRKYKLLAKTLQADMLAENEAQERYYEMAFIQNKSHKVRTNTLKQFVATLQQYDCTTPDFVKYYYSIRTILNWDICDHLTIKRDCSMALKILKNKKGVYNSTLQFFARNQALAHTALREYVQAQALLVDAEKYAPPRSRNLGILRHYQAIVALHSSDYQQAYQLYRQHRKSPFKELREQWDIMSAYLYFLKKTGHINTGKDRFSIGKYLNETAAVARSSQGDKTNILIGELLVYLVDKRSQFIERMEATHQFSYKALKNSAVRRSRWLLRILCSLPRFHFKIDRALQHHSNLLAQLKEQPIQIGGGQTTEFIPFEQLLSILAQDLQHQVA